MVNEHPVTDTRKASVSAGRPVLAAVDFSDDAREALIWAAEYAARTGADLVILHVVHDPASQPGYYREDTKGQVQTLQTAARDMLDVFVGSMREERADLDALQSAELQLIPGLPPGRIVETAQALDARLIVIGSRGMTGLPHLLQGSVSERVVKLADRPVVVVKSGDAGG